MFKLSLGCALFVQLLLLSGLTVAVLTFNLVEWSVRDEQLTKIRELSENPQTTLQQQLDLFSDVKKVLSNQEIILGQLANQTNGTERID